MARSGPLPVLVLSADTDSAYAEASEVGLYDRGGALEFGVVAVSRRVV